jgi:hypothetical protein
MLELLDRALAAYGLVEQNYKSSMAVALARRAFENCQTQLESLARGRYSTPDPDESPNSPIYKLTEGIHTSMVATSAGGDLLWWLDTPATRTWWRLNLEALERGVAIKRILIYHTWSDELDRLARTQQEAGVRVMRVCENELPAPLRLNLIIWDGSCALEPEYNFSGEWINATYTFAPQDLALALERFKLIESCAEPWPAPGDVPWGTGGQFQFALFEGDQARAGKGIVLLRSRQVPGQYRDLPGDRDDRDLEAAPGRDPLVQGAQWSRGAQRGERGLHQHAAGLTRPGLGDAPVMGGLPAGLVDRRAQAEVGDELVGAGEPVEVPDRGQHGDRGHRVHPGNGHQPSHQRVVHGLDRQRPLHLGQLATVEVQPAQQRRDGRLFVDRQRLAREPCTAAGAEQVAHRRALDHVAVQHCLDLILDPDARAHQLAPARAHTPQHPDALVRQPGTRQEVRGQQLREDARIDLVRLDLRLGDRPGLERVGDHHAGHVWFEHHRDRLGVAGGLQRNLVVRQQTRGELPQRLQPARHPASIGDEPVVHHRDLREVPMHIQSDEPSHRVLHPLDAVRESAGRNDTYGIAFTTQSDKSQGRPFTKAGSQPIVQHRPAHADFPGAPCPDGRTVQPS